MDKLLHQMRQVFGFDSFRPGQREVVEAIINRRDVLVVMPTGGGKSLCFQLPALMLEGVTLVISPLIALMKDQVDGLLDKRVAVTFINSSVSATEQYRRIEAINKGDYRLVYVAPERFRHKHFVEALQQTTIAFCAVDEAHCVSMWGHDFRPDYLRIGDSLKKLGSPPMAAFTATATPEVRDDIQSHLRLREPTIFVTGFARPNLAFRVTHVSSSAQKYARLKEIIERCGTGIIYCATRKRVAEVSASLAGWDVTHVAYHAGMEDGERKEAQEVFMTGRMDAVVATNAFGMGIDRADIRFVVHFELPGSVEAYYQEAGRAGRDGQPAICELLFTYADKRIQEFFIEGANPSVAVIADVYRVLRGAASAEFEVRLSIKAIAELMGPRSNGMAVSSALTVLSRHGYIDRFDIPGERIRGTRLLKPQCSPHQLEIDRAALAEKDRRDRRKLENVIRYAYNRACRQRFILSYFEDTCAANCAKCDVCEPSDSLDLVESTAPELREPDDEELLILQKALSGVARMSRRDAQSTWVPRFGKARIIDMLMGSRSQEIKRAGLDSLTTHGILKPEGREYLSLLFRELDRRGFIRTELGEYPLVTLTASGEQAMKAPRTSRIEWPARNVSKPKCSKRVRRTPQAVDSEPNLELLELLKQKRIELARARGGKPAYTIFPDVTLEHLAASQPLSAEECRGIPGIGAVRARTVLPTFLRVVAAWRLRSENA